MLFRSCIFTDWISVEKGALLRNMKKSFGYRLSFTIKLLALRDDAYQSSIITVRDLENGEDILEIALPQGRNHIKLINKRLNDTIHYWTISRIPLPLFAETQFEVREQLQERGFYLYEAFINGSRVGLLEENHRPVEGRIKIYAGHPEQESAYAVIKDFKFLRYKEPGGHA